MAERAFVSRFSPNRTDPAVLEAIFVQRHRLAEVWLQRLRDSVLTDARHHLLAVGPRGCGKSHLVALLVSRLRKDPAVRERVRIAWLPEDETTPSFWKFLLRILRALNAEYGDEFPPPPRDQLADAADDRRSAVLTDYLLKKLDGRTLLVVVENLDDVMGGLKNEGQKRWRAFLQEHPVATTLATSQRLTKEVSNRDRPFFAFFQIEHLQPLNADEALALLRKIAEHSGNTDLAAFLQTPTGRARVRAIRHITGGSHRVFIILSEFATREKLDDLVTAFEELLDELTPYYQERLRWLPDQQREIVEFLCRQTRTVPVKEIAAELFLTEQTAAAQLKSLKDKGYVTAETVGRESRYELAEPLMRLCVEVKDPQREPIRLVVEFLRIWYDRAGVEARLQSLPGDAVLERRYYQAVLQAHRPDIPNPVMTALNRDLEAARATGDPEEVVRVLVELAATADMAWLCLAVAYELTGLGRHAEALAAYDRAIELEPDFYAVWAAKGHALSSLGRHAEALNAWDRTIELKPDMAVAWSYKGFALHELGRHAEALASCNRAIELEPNSAAPWHNKGVSLHEVGRRAEALAAWDRAIELEPDLDAAWTSKGHALNELGRHAEALAAWDRAIELKPDDAIAWGSKGYTLNKLGRHAEALAVHDQTIKLIPNDAGAWNNKGYALNELGRYAEALAALDRAIELKPSLCAAWSGKGYALNELRRHDEALAACDRAIELQPDHASAWKNRGRAKLGAGRIGEALEDLRRAIKLDGEYAGAFESLAEALTLAGTWDEAAQVLADRFRLPRSANNPARSQHLPDVIVAILRASADRRVWPHWVVARLVAIAAKANALADLSDSLVRSLRRKAYAEASADALDAWAGVWRNVAKRHPRLSLATRLFSVGVRYLQTKDERVLLDLVQEERSILRELFSLDGES